MNEQYAIKDHIKFHQCDAKMENANEIVLNRNLYLLLKNYALRLFWLGNQIEGHENNLDQSKKYMHFI